VDEGALREHVEFVIEAGVQGIMPCGTTGETALLEPDETLAVVRAVVDAAAGRVPVVAHVGRPSTRATARLIEAAIGAGAEAERPQEEVRAIEREVSAGPPLVALKQRVSELMPARGARYPAALRSPLGG